MAKKKVVSPVEYEITIEPEEMDYHGNCSAIDEETDRENEQWVTDQLNSGNECAWCWVGVRATFGEYHGDDSLGGISCKNHEDLEALIKGHGMYENALANLKERLTYVAERAVPKAEEEAKQARAALKTIAKWSKS